MTYFIVVYFIESLMLANWSLRCNNDEMCSSYVKDCSQNL